MHINLNWRCQYDCVEDKINLIIGNFLDWIILQKIILSISSMYFTISLLFPPGKRSGPCIWTNLNILHPRMLYAKSGWIWLHCSLKVDILFLLFPNYFLLGKDVVLHLNKLESCLPKGRLPRWRSRLECSPPMWKDGCSNPSRNRPTSWKQVETAPLPNGNRCECDGSSEMTIINRFSMSQ